MTFVCECVRPCSVPLLVMFALLSRCGILPPRVPSCCLPACLRANLPKGKSSGPSRGAPAIFVMMRADWRLGKSQAP